MTPEIFIYLLIGFGCAVRADEDDNPPFSRLCVFLFLLSAWPVCLGAIIAKEV